MASTQITIDDQQVLAIASQLESDNKKLMELLDNSESKINGLSSYWTGQAAEETRNAYKSFSNKFKQQYYDIIDQYVKFLRRNVAEGYSETEQRATKLAEGFK